VKHLKNCIFYTNYWKAFAKVLQPKRDIIRKFGTVAIEQGNSNTRYYLGRFTRCTEVVSKKNEMIKISVKSWVTPTYPQTPDGFKKVVLSVYK
jgi:IS1 family transposase